jgi:hypothetical protein
LIVDREQFETSYITINTTKKPLDDVRLRKAINMAINKDRIVRIVNGRATAANQVLPPLMPGYDKAYKGHPYDVEGAKKLMEEAGLKDGFTTTLYAMNTDPNPRIAQAIQQDVAAVGVKAEIKALAQPETIAAGGNKDQAALTWSGGMGWIADPSDFYGPILGCGGAIAGGWNWSLFCDKSFEDRETKADAMSKQVKGADLKSPRFSTPGPVTRHLDGAGYEATTGLGPDLMTATREAVSPMIDLLAAEHGLNPIGAYLLWRFTHQRGRGPAQLDRFLLLSADRLHLAR